MTYKKSGVNIDSGDSLVSAIKPKANSTSRTGVVSEIGGFGGMFDPKEAGYIDPILVAATDGVGTKLLIASIMDKHDTIGIDLVAMCANDLVVMGAEPLFFLDYFATGTLNVEVGYDIISGIAEGCHRAGCALIGGETAEMPGMYAPRKYDLAGFCVGAVERNKIITTQRVREGDLILGLASSGLHSNGFSLVRNLLEHTGDKYEEPAPFDSGATMGHTLLTPTRIYVKSILAAIDAGGVHGLAHITGGGFLENIPRVLPNGLGAKIDAAAWTVPEIFQWIAIAGNISGEEMLRTFNCGIGMVAIVAQDRAKDLNHVLTSAGETVFEIGQIINCNDDDVVSIIKPELLWKN